MAESERFPVQLILTDKGSEFVNKEMAAWYAARGIEHVKVGPKSSHLNPCERVHQTLITMMKAAMHSAGFPRSFWIYALLNAVFVKNHVYCKAIKGIPYQRMFGVVPDIHHIRPFGCLVYVQVPVSPEKQKHDPNAMVAFLLGYREDTVGCLVHIPSEKTVKFVAEVRVREDITYADRHGIDPADRNTGIYLSKEPPEDVDDDKDTHDAASSFGQDASRDDDMGSAHDENDENDGVSATASFETNTIVIDSVDNEGEPNRADADDDSEQETDDYDGHSIDHEDDASVSADYGSDVDSSENEGLVNSSEQSADGSAEGGEVPTAAVGAGPEAEDLEGEAQVDHTTVSPRSEETVTPPPEVGRKRAARDDTESEIERNQVGFDTKMRRTGLREWSKIRARARYDDFVRLANMATRIIGKNGRAISADNLAIPKNRRAAMRSKYAEFWRQAEQEEMRALKAKGVLEELDAKAMPEGSRAVRTMWVYALKTDAHGFIIRF
jgi:hypothetical protein